MAKDHRSDDATHWGELTIAQIDQINQLLDAHNVPPCEEGTQCDDDACTSLLYHRIKQLLTPVPKET